MVLRSQVDLMLWIQSHALFFIQQKLEVPHLQKLVKKRRRQRHRQTSGSQTQSMTRISKMPLSLMLKCGQKLSVDQRRNLRNKGPYQGLN